MEKREETSLAGGSLWPEFWAGGAFRDPEFQVDLWIPRPGSMVPLKRLEISLPDALLDRELSKALTMTIKRPIVTRTEHG